MTLFRVAKPTRLTPGHERRYRHEGTERSERNYVKPRVERLAEFAREQVQRFTHARWRKS